MKKKPHKLELSRETLTVLADGPLQHAGGRALLTTWQEPTKDTFCFICPEPTLVTEIQ